MLKRLFVMCLLGSAVCMAQYSPPIPLVCISGNCSVPTGSTLTAAGLLSSVTTSTLAALYSGTYTSGITTTCTSGQHCNLTFSDGATATLACAVGGNSITGSTALASIVAGTGLATPPTTATVSSGTATSCTGGAAVLATVTAISPTGSGTYLNGTSGAVTYVLPVITTSTIGSQVCFRQLTTKSGVLTLLAPSLTYIDKSGANGSVAGNITSGGAAGDQACMLANSTTQYLYIPVLGTWTNH